MLRAITHVVSPAIGRCELTYLEREPINFNLAARQHEEYCGLLAYCGAEVTKLSASLAYPDCSFVEDTAIVLDEVAIITSMGAASRRSETLAIETELAKRREIAHIQLPATIEGGDVLRMGRKVFVGLSSRTNAEGFAELARILKPLGYDAVPVHVKSSLHLTTACSSIDDETVLLNPRWADAAPFEDFKLVHTPKDEPWAANTVRIGNAICLEANFPRTIELVQKFHSRIEVLDISEFRKAEAGLSCLSIIFED